MAWHHYGYAGRVRPRDGLIGLVMQPFISGHLVGRDTFERDDVLAPSWGGQ
ncbi:hypothetical protein B0H17DRAFT_1119236, partial [Mycena rosella]